MTNTTAHERVSYLPPSREGKKAIVAYVDPLVAQGLKIVAGVYGQSVQEYLSGLVERDISEKQSKDLKSTIRQITARLSTAARSAKPRQLHAPTPAPSRS